MVTVEIKKNHLGKIEGYRISGHAGYADYGEDIVCSAVSVLAFTCLNSLIEVCQIDEEELDYEAHEGEGYLDVNLPKKLENNKYDRSQIVLKTLELGIRSLVEGYPKFVSLKYRRCER